MAKQNFELKAGQPYIQLNKLLQVMHIAQTGGHAKILIQNEAVLVKIDDKNGRIATTIPIGTITVNSLRWSDH